MVKAANKHMTRVQNGSWKAPDEIYKELMALRAEVDRNKNRSSTKQPNKSSNKWNTGKNQRNQGSIKYISDKTWKNCPDWLRTHQRPENVHKPKFYDNIKFYYCCDETKGHCGGKWVRHRAKDCVPRKKKPHSEYQEESTTRSDHKRKVSFKHDKEKSKNANYRAKKAKEAAALIIESPESDSE